MTNRHKKIKIHPILHPMNKNTNRKPSKINTPNNLSTSLEKWLISNVKYKANIIMAHMLCWYKINAF